MSANDWNDTITKTLLIPFIIIWAILMVIFGFLDLQISQAAVQSDSAWGSFGADYGELPGYGIIVLALVILIGSFNDDIKKQKITGYVFIIIGIIFLLYGIIGDSSTMWRIGGGTILFVPLFMVYTWNKDWNDYVTIAQVVILYAIIAPLIITQLTKTFTQRVRFRDLTAGFPEYTPWWAPPGIGVREFDSNTSFPSGHSSISWIFLPFLILVRDDNLKSLKRILVTTLVIGWGVFVSASRVNVGAHYASDVTFSTGAAVLTTVFLYWLYYFKKGKG